MVRREAAARVLGSASCESVRSRLRRQIVAAEAAARPDSLALKRRGPGILHRAGSAPGVAFRRVAAEAAARVLTAEVAGCALGSASRESVRSRLRRQIVAAEAAARPDSLSLKRRGPGILNRAGSAPELRFVASRLKPRLGRRACR